MDVGDDIRTGTRKRKRGFMKKKLRVNEKVELRSLEEGFLGSWHPGVIIRSGRLKRHVQYDNILNDDEVNNLVEVVNVSRVLEGIISSSIASDCSYQRKIIRPIPPPIEFRVKDLPFGLCVDVNYEEAWWEGVIFDHCDGMGERSVFFPDLGDEMKIGIQQLRITQDWDEITGNWTPRGKWVFLELFEECERVSYVAISVKQIWYDIRIRKDFEDNIKDWCCNVKDLWRDMVMDVIGDYYNLTVNEVLSALNIPKDFFERSPELGSFELTTDNVQCDPSHRNVISSEKENGDSMDIDQTNPLVDEEFEKQTHLHEEPASPLQQSLPEPQQEMSCDDAEELKSISNCTKKTRKRRRSPMSIIWKRLIMSKVEFCPGVVEQYAHGCRSKKVRELLKVKVRKHLAYLGWIIEWTENKYLRDQRRYRYKSPDKSDNKVYTSISKVTKVLLPKSRKNSELPQVDHNRMHSTMDNNLSHLLSDPQTNQDSDVNPPTGQNTRVQVEVEPEFCPVAVVKFYMHAIEKNSAAKRKWKLNAKKHLLAEGWIFDYPTKKRRTTLYKSPKNQCLGTLQGACRVYLKEKIPQWTNSDMSSLNVLAFNNEINIDGDELLDCVSQLVQKEPEVYTSRSTEKRNHKRGRRSKASIPKSKSKEVPTRVLRSSKRVQKVLAPCQSHQNPQNVLSWLIDCEIVLPKYKVYYRSKDGNNLPVHEGRIAREGIKCTCCQKIYSISSFVSHVGDSSNCRPSASIFLNDGRSLFDCMVEVMHDHRTKKVTGKQYNDLCEGENDNVCSVCNYGGELILCDSCPSSFHKQCLSLKDIPDGDWFCPSCRCRICGQSKNEGTEEGKFLTCTQCEHKYHVECLRKKAKDESRIYLENWFCGENCKGIFEGLQNLLGKPVLVGKDNITWTLVKCDNSENDLMAENYSKLSVALSLMHECFESLVNRFTGKDIVEEVLFNRRSELKRLNLQGFYSILLERNEELISVATVRIFGGKVAELPLVGTRLQYRRLGMCRILVDELEKNLKQLGVERLVLPAVPDVLKTWTNAFGFARMTNNERSQFLDYAFLDFQGTIMCQKLLTRISSPESGLTGTPPKPQDVISVKCKIDFERPSPVSEVEQAEEIAKCGVMDLQVWRPLPTCVK